MRLLWSKEEDEILRKLWINREITLREMTQVLKSRTQDAIRAHADKLGLPKNNERMKPKIDLDYYRKLTEVVEG